MVKHIWKITPRGRKSKYYDCECGAHVVATSKKEADSLTGECQINSIRWEKALKVIKNI